MQKLQQRSKKKEIIDSASLPRSKGPQVNLVPLENMKSPGDEVGPQVPQEGGGELLNKVFPRSNHLFFIYHFWQKWYPFRIVPAIDNCITFTYLV